MFATNFNRTLKFPKVQPPLPTRFNLSSYRRYNCSNRIAQSTTQENSKMKYERLTAKHADQAAGIICEAFRSDEVYNWGRALQRPPEMFNTYMNKVHIPEVVADTTTPSFVALDESDDAVVGVLTIEDFMKSDDTRSEEDSSTEPIPAILNSLHEMFWQELRSRKHESKENAGRICYFAFLAVSPAHRRKKIGESLFRKGVQEVAKAGYRIAVAFCTSPKSTSLLANIGFEQWGEIPYKHFQLPSDGSTPFAVIPDSVTVMVKYVQSEGVTVC